MADVNYYWEIKDFIGKGGPLKDAILSFSFHSAEVGVASGGQTFPLVGGYRTGISVTRERDRWSALLVQSVADGRQFSNVILKARRYQDRTPISNFKVFLDNVLFMGLQIHDEIEVYELGFKDIKFEHNA